MEPTQRALGRLAAGALAAGRKLTLAEAIAEAAATAPDRPVATHDPLSPRERQVAALIQRGQTNRQIATDLIVGEGTVATHVQHILAKLDLHSRAQIAVWVTQNGQLDAPQLHPGGNDAALPR
jgi:DNA-binding NarL/FixJ family response regulator